ncbi:MAG: GIY-YIG nuclease family protein [Candidatus Dojkabacteria bacterium]|nr:MAG: GIY-YIG nuclease family protein [Candidatus Dojkabacteria bacterium]
MTRVKLQEKLKLLPNSPGVYLYYNEAHDIIYVGKAKNLKNRVSSYFVNTYKGPKTTALLSRIVDLDTIVVRSEVEAFLLEAELIKRYKPKYNIDLKDDKSYLYIAVQDFDIVVDGIKHTLSKVFSTRTKKLKRTKYFGPFPAEAQAVKKALRALRKVFPYCEYSGKKLQEHVNKKRACLYYHIGLCPGTCVGVENFPVQQKNIRALKELFTKGYNRVLEDMQIQMQKHSNNFEYEKALEIRKFLDNMTKLETSNIIPDQYVENPNLIEDLYAKRAEEIQKIFGFDHEINRVECYDISNIMGDWATGSMVVSENGRLAKSQYRRFRIKFTKGITDFGMMTEVLSRRVKKDWNRPDILLIDGGRGQVSVVLKAIKGTPFEDIPVVGIFKPNDFFLRRINNRWRIIKPLKDNSGYLHLRELRDEAHRFAKGYHKMLRRKEPKG